MSVLVRCWLDRRHLDISLSEISINIWCSLRSLGNLCFHSQHLQKWAHLYVSSFSIQLIRFLLFCFVFLLFCRIQFEFNWHTRKLRTYSLDKKERYRDREKNTHKVNLIYEKRVETKETDGKHKRKMLRHDTDKRKLTHENLMKWHTNTQTHTPVTLINLTCLAIVFMCCRIHLDNIEKNIFIKTIQMSSYDVLKLLHVI